MSESRNLANDASQTKSSEQGTASQTPAATVPRRRWLSFSLRAALVALTLLAVAFGILGLTLRRVEQQLQAERRAEKVFLELGAQIKTAPYEPKWLARLLELTGVETPDRILELEFINVEFTEEALLHFAELSALRKLVVDDCNLNDADLLYLSHLTQLEHVRLSHCPITDAGLQHLEGFSNLRTLAIRTLVAGPGLESIHAPRLESLSVGYFPFADPSGNSPARPEKGIRLPPRFLARFPELKRLGLGDLNVTDDDLSYLNAPLERLGVNGTLVSDHGLSTFRHSETLRNVNFQNTRFADVTLDVLATCPNMQRITFVDARITEKGVERLTTLSKLSTLHLLDTDVVSSRVYDMKRQGLFSPTLDLLVFSKRDFPYPRRTQKGQRR